MRMVKCIKLGQELPGLDFQPFDDELGEKIYQHVSQKAWDMWLAESPRYINTYRLDLSDPQAQEFLRQQMKVFFGFEKGEMARTAWTPPREPR
ncbi:MAG: oxidative damage protection protein [Myxococcota bacterium]|nr:oxidative damage protection protein [Myxococcota bacterium]